METFDFQILKITSLQLVTILIGITLLPLFKFSYPCTGGGGYFAIALKKKFHA